MVNHDIWVQNGNSSKNEHLTHYETATFITRTPVVACRSGQAIYVNQAKHPLTPQRDSMVVHYLFALSKNITPQQDKWIDSLRHFSAQQNNHFGLLLWQVVDAEKVIRTLNFKEGIRKHIAFARQLEAQNRARYAICRPGSLVRRHLGRRFRAGRRCSEPDSGAD